MAAFERAVRLGYRYLETDVRASADGVLVAFHDHTLDRVTDREGRVHALPYAEIARARIGGREPIPRIEDLLGTWPEVRLNVDVKEMATVPLLARVLDRARAHHRVCVASFSGRRLAAARGLLGPQVCTSMSPREATALRLASAARVPGAAGLVVPGDIPCVQLPPSVAGLPVVTPALVQAVHELGMQVHVWTVNDRSQMRRLLDIGVDGLITDCLETLRDLLADRGLWSPQ